MGARQHCKFWWRSQYSYHQRTVWWWWKSIYTYTMPSAAGLFKRAIVQSGSTVTLQPQENATVLW
ncbi:hypothetical protein RHP51_00165 [Thalassobellus suaedae]|uniref:Uncharacterized protein n=1 Tax=Thalassobellus suaedae TaxID=3074124 RepID=A0ABY9XTH3_9FLAO|nr:hypothetical protein RHP51_00165 [Flavobacteriaceae bacterium HL-DH14]